MRHDRTRSGLDEEAGTVDIRRVEGLGRPPSRGDCAAQVHPRAEAQQERR